MDELYSLLQKICKDCAEIVKAAASSIYLKEGEDLTMKAAFGYSQVLINKAIYKLGDGITGWIGEGHSFIANSSEEIKAHPKWYGKYNKELWGTKKVSCLLNVTMNYYPTSHKLIEKNVKINEP
ncbi:MAG: hypothetical protein K6U80_15215 [Firmicutes bacterium]|nr:hypothetical protein [Bacillota bacterium]